MKIEALILAGAALANALSSREHVFVRRAHKAAQTPPQVDGFSDDLNSKLSGGFKNALKNVVDVTHGYSGPNEIDGIPLIYASNTGQRKSSHGGLEAFANTSLYRNAPSKEDVESGKVTKVKVTQDDVNILNKGSLSNFPVYYSEIPVGNSSKHLKPIIGGQSGRPNTGCCSLTQKQKNQQESLTDKEKAKHPEIAQKQAKVASAMGNKKNEKRDTVYEVPLLGDVTAYSGAGYSPFMDAFYHPVQSALNLFGKGSPIAYRLVGYNAFALPVGTRSYQVQYRSENTAGDQAIAGITTIFIPPSNPNPGFTLGITFHENALNIGCSLSWFWAIGRADQSLGEWLNRGWVIVAPDHEGLNSAFLASTLGAKLLLDALRSANSLAPMIAIEAPKQVGLFGYSAGSSIIGVAGRLIPSYAPEFAPGGSIPVIAIAVGGFIVDLKKTINYINKSMWTAFIIMGVIGIGTEYPQLASEAMNILNGDWGTFRYYTSYIGCAEQQVVNFYMQDFSEVFNDFNGYLARDDVASTLNANSVNSPMIDVPVYIDTSSGDEVADVNIIDDLVNKWCAAGRRITYYRNPDKLAHLDQEPHSETSAMNFFDQVVNGKFSQGSCGVPLDNPL